MKFEGIYTPLVTPHSEAFKIEREKCKPASDLLIQAGASDLIVASITGKDYAPTINERVELSGLNSGDNIA